MRAKRRNQQIRVIILQLCYTTHTPTIKKITRISFYVSLSTFPSSRKKIRNPYLLIITITIATISIITNIKYKYIVCSKIIIITTMLHNTYCYYKTITRISIYASLSSLRSYRLSQLQCKR